MNNFNNNSNTYDIRGSHDGEDVDFSLLAFVAVLVMFVATYVSAEHMASIFRIPTEDGGDVFLRNVGNHLQLHNPKGHSPQDDSILYCAQPVVEVTARNSEGVKIRFILSIYSKI